MNDIKVVVLDVDGVILDSLVGTIGAINRALSMFGGEPIKSDWFKKNKLGSFKEFIFSRGVSKDVDWDGFCEVLNQFLFRVWLYRERSGIRPVLNFFQERGLPIYLLSACDADLTRAKISFHHGLIDFINKIYGGENKLEVFHSLIEEQGVGSSDILFITDMPRDIDQAELAGIQKIVAMVSDFSSKEQFVGHTWQVVQNNEELLPLLENLF